MCVNTYIHTYMYIHICACTDASVHSYLHIIAHGQLHGPVELRDGLVAHRALCHGDECTPHSSVCPTDSRCCSGHTPRFHSSDARILPQLRLFGVPLSTRLRMADGQAACSLKRCSHLATFREARQRVRANPLQRRVLVHDLLCWFEENCPHLIEVAN